MRRRAVGKQRIIFVALYAEICLAFPVVDALKEGYDATFVVDAVGGMSQLAHRTAIERIDCDRTLPDLVAPRRTRLSGRIKLAIPDCPSCVNDSSRSR
jgi:hypothetical protein